MPGVVACGEPPVCACKLACLLTNLCGLCISGLSSDTQLAMHTVSEPGGDTFDYSAQARGTRPGRRAFMERKVVLSP